MSDEPQISQTQFIEPSPLKTQTEELRNRKGKTIAITDSRKRHSPSLAPERLHLAPDPLIRALYQQSSNQPKSPKQTTSSSSSSSENSNTTIPHSSSTPHQPSLDDLCDQLYVTFLSREEFNDSFDKAVLAALKARYDHRHKMQELTNQAEREKLKVLANLEAAQSRIRELEATCRQAVTSSSRRDDPDQEDQHEGENTRGDHQSDKTEELNFDKTEELNLEESEGSIRQSGATDPVDIGQTTTFSYANQCVEDEDEAPLESEFLNFDQYPGVQKPVSFLCNINFDKLVNLLAHPSNLSQVSTEYLSRNLNPIKQINDGFFKKNTQKRIREENKKIVEECLSLKGNLEVLAKEKEDMGGRVSKLSD